MVRHLVMRIALGFVFGWFGAQQVLGPEDWVQFIPSVLDGVGLVAPAGLIQMHGALLLATSLALLTGFMLTVTCLVAAGLLGSIIVVLLVSGGPYSGLVVRNLGLVALAIGILLDPVRVWDIDPRKGLRRFVPLGRQGT